MSIKKASARTAVNSGTAAAVAVTINQILVAPVTATSVAGGGSLGVTISNIDITDNTFANVLSGDTAVSSSGGFIKITGSGFKNNAKVFFNNAVIANTFISSSQINANVPATISGNYSFYVVNSDGVGAFYPSSIRVSGPPSWTSTSYDASSLTLGIQLLATGDAPLSYYIKQGSANPQNLSVNSTGYLTGTVSQAGAYTITVIVDDAEFQSAQADITITVVESEPYFKDTVLLLSADGTNNANNSSFVDSSINNFTVTRNGNTTQGSFSPFSPTGWSGYFNGTSQYITSPTSTAVNLGSGDYTTEFWCHSSSLGSGSAGAMYLNNYTPTGYIHLIRHNGSVWECYYKNGTAFSSVSTSVVPINQWNHHALTRSGSTVKWYLNGVLRGIGTDTTNYSSGTAYIRNGEYANYFYDGYISNFRFVKGTALYTGGTNVGDVVFTPSTTPLTAIANTAYLVCQSNRFLDNSTNALTVTGTGSPSIQAFSPFPPSSVYNASNNGGSGYFDGTGDYLDLGTNSAFQISGDFTAEMMIYVTNFSGGEQLLAGPISPGGWSMNVSNGTLGLTDRGSGYLTTPANSVNKNEWVHVCFMHTAGGNDYLYINGVQRASGSGRTLTGSSTFTVGGQSGYGFYQGYISSLRIVKGSLVYNTAGFTPPSAPLTAITNTSLLLNFTNAGIYDASGKTVFETVGTAKLSTVQSKWGNSSIILDGDGDYLVAPYTPNFSFGTGDFTFEFYVRFISVTQCGFISGVGNGSLDIRYVPSNSTLRLGRLNVAFDSSFSWSPSTGVWYHVAMSRQNGSVKAFIEGTQIGTTSSNTNTYNLSGSFLAGITVFGAANDSPNAYIDDVRVTKGYARYTANFTPPTYAHRLR